MPCLGLHIVRCMYDTKVPFWPAQGKKKNESGIGPREQKQPGTTYNERNDK